jgi:hypothetical protein
MKIRSVIVNNRKTQVELVVRSGHVYPFPFARPEPPPTSSDRIREAYVDRGLATRRLRMCWSQMRKESFISSKLSNTTRTMLPCRSSRSSAHC